MLISAAILQGLRITGMYKYTYNIVKSFQCLTSTVLCFSSANSFIGLIRYLYSLPEIKNNQIAFLSQHLCQDPLERYFGCQRQRGGTSDNPNAVEFGRNTQALRVVNSFCRGPVKGSCRGSQEVKGKETTPLLKRHTVRRN